MSQKSSSTQPSCFVSQALTSDMRQGQRFLRAELLRILGTSSADLSPNMAQIIVDLAGDWRRLDERIDRLSAEIEALARQDASCERLTSVGRTIHWVTQR